MLGDRLRKGVEDILSGFFAKRTVAIKHTVDGDGTTGNGDRTQLFLGQLGLFLGLCSLALGFGLGSWFGLCFEKFFGRSRRRIEVHSVERVKQTQVVHFIHKESVLVLFSVALSRHGPGCHEKHLGRLISKGFWRFFSSC